MQATMPIPFTFAEQQERLTRLQGLVTRMTTLEAERDRIYSAPRRGNTDLSRGSVEVTIFPKASDMIPDSKDVTRRIEETKTEVRRSLKEMVTHRMHETDLVIGPVEKRVAVADWVKAMCKEHGVEIPEK